MSDSTQTAPARLGRESLNLPNLITMSRFVLSLILFAIIDHYSRRDEGQDFVVGTLLGTDEGGTIHWQSGCDNLTTDALKSAQAEPRGFNAVVRPALLPSMVAMSVSET